MDETKVVPAEESNITETAETVAEIKEVTIGDALHEEKRLPKMVPESVLIEYKKESKSVRRELDSLKKSIEEGATKTEVKQSISDLASKHNIDASFLNEFAKAMKEEAEADIEDRIASKMKPIQDKEISEKREKIFEEHFNKTLEAMPEYKNLINKDVIKSLALNPANRDKTFAQIFQDSYGHLVTGKRTLESTKPRGGAKDTTIDLQRASRDEAYLKEVLSDPQLKKVYNEGLAQRNNL